MIRSMTAYARYQTHTPDAEIVWEIRSLNSRYLETHLKVGEEWRALEAEIRERLSRRLKRGKVECQLRFKRLTQGGASLSLNAPLCEALLQVADEVQSQAQHLAPMTVMDVLRWPGLVAEPEQDVNAVASELLSCLDQAVDELIVTREREGEKIKQMITQRCDEMSEKVAQIRLHVPEIRQHLEEKLRQKLADIDIQVDATRFEQELVFYLARLDVDEEIDRLQSHIDEVKAVLERRDSVGRRLDFLMQELNREANTLGSKVTHLDIKGISVDLKVLIEQMREQIQNIE